MHNTARGGKRNRCAARGARRSMREAVAAARRAWFNRSTRVSQHGEALFEMAGEIKIGLDDLARGPKYVENVLQ